MSFTGFLIRRALTVIPLLIGVVFVTFMLIRIGGLDPVGKLAGAVPAAQRLVDARVRGERVLILGDFDADGATATALCVSCLRALGFPDVVYVVPNRIEYGYGLSPAIAEHAATLGPDLIVTVDNGVSSVEGVRAAATICRPSHGEWLIGFST